MEVVRQLEIFVPCLLSRDAVPDGQAFKSRDGQATVRVWGEYEVAEGKGKTSLQVLEGFALENAKTKGITIEYKVEKPHLFALSGDAADGSIWYQKTTDAKGTAVSLEAEYPAARKAEMDAVVARMAGCLRVAK